MKVVLSILLAFISFQFAYPQTELEIYLNSDLENRVENIDSAKRVELIKEQVSTLINSGYLLARIDSQQTDSLKQQIFIEKGKQYKWLSLSAKDENLDLLQEAGFKSRYFEGEVISPTELNLLKSRVLRLCENKGFPFAEVALDKVDEKEEGLTAELSLSKGPLILIDSIAVLGETETNPNYIRNYLELKKGRPYNESLLASVPLRIKENPFLEVKKEPEIYFESGAARVNLYIEDKKANVIDGILGLLPDEFGDVVLTGDIKLNLLNSFKQGDGILLNWRKLQDRTQDIKIQGDYPFLLNTPIGLGANFFLYRRDTLFSSIRAQARFNYRIKGNNQLSLSIGRSSSNIISTAGLANISNLPDYADVSINFYGIGFNFEKLDYRYNPTKGYQISFEANTGQKVIRENPAINPELYDSLNLRSTQFELSTDIKLFIPLFSRNTIVNRIQSGWLQNEQLFRNELFRIGGIQTLRGFDIEEIFASFYTIYSFEYRFLLEQNSYLFAFADIAYYEDLSIGNRSFDQPIGIGAGMSFETRAGIFSFSYALGRQQNNPFLLRTGKIHFGLVNYF